MGKTADKKDYSAGKEEKKSIELSYKISAQITKVNSSFYLGITFSKKKYRNALYAIYAWMRAADDIADDEQHSLEERKKQLNEFEDMTLRLLQNEIKPDINLENTFWLAFCDTVHRFNIPVRYLTEMIDCQRQDLFKFNYKNFTELYEYCRLAASSVGLIFITIFGYKGGEKAEQLAEFCGVAFQLTNILRDIHEDLRFGRVYLPADLVGVEELTANNFRNVPREKIMTSVLHLFNKTDTYYQEAMVLYSMLHRDGKLSFLILVKSYKALFKKMCEAPETIFNGSKIKLTKKEKVKTLLNALYRHSLFEKHQ